VIDGHKDDGSHLIIKPRNLRGIENKSMVCSEKELGFSDEHEGIMLLEGVDAPPGTPLQDVLGDAVLEIELTPNLARNYSVLGIAREVAALTGQRTRHPSLDAHAMGPSIEGQVRINIREPELNPRFTLALLKGVTIQPSPEWMQRRLRQSGMRPINNIVDVTNYVMLETGQPLHAFDYDVLVQRAGGKAPTIITRLPEPGEALTTLDGVIRQLDPSTILVADTDGALSLGGIMGGAESEIYDAATYTLDAQGVEPPGEGEKKHGKADARPESTQNVLLEAAAWNYINIRQTLSAQQRRGKEIASEAAARFSRGVHPAQAEVGLRRAIELMRQLGGGEIAQGILDEYPRPARTMMVNLPMREVERIVGISLSQDEVAHILQGLEFNTERVGADALRVTVPDHRLDIGYVYRPQDEDIAELVGQADLIEEIARIYGYDRIPNTLIADELPPQRNNDSLIREERVRDALIHAGLQEIVTHRLTTPEREALLTPAGSKSSWRDLPYVTLANPMSADKVAMRHTLLSGVLNVVAANARWRDRQAVFEIGRVYLPTEDQPLPAEPTASPSP
jgi:phenylalanyl-tRNA synthetase beta chain